MEDDSRAAENQPPSEKQPSQERALAAHPPKKRVSFQIDGDNEETGKELTSDSPHTVPPSLSKVARPPPPKRQPAHKEDKQASISKTSKSPKRPTVGPAVRPPPAHKEDEGAGKESQKDEKKDDESSKEEEVKLVERKVLKEEEREPPEVVVSEAQEEQVPAGAGECSDEANQQETSKPEKTDDSPPPESDRSQSAPKVSPSIQEPTAHDLTPTRTNQERPTDKHEATPAAFRPTSSSFSSHVRKSPPLLSKGGESEHVQARSSSPVGKRLSATEEVPGVRVIRVGGADRDTKGEGRGSEGGKYIFMDDSILDNILKYEKFPCKNFPIHKRT